jgi:hypothetical protein
VVEHEIIRDHATNRSRGFGFIVFDAEKTVDELLAKKGNMIDLNGSQVRFHVVLSDLCSFVQSVLHAAINCGSLVYSKRADPVVSSVSVALVTPLYVWRVISTPFLELNRFERKYRLTFLLCCRWRSRRQNQSNPLTHHHVQLIANLGSVHMRTVMMDLAAPITMVVVLAPIDHLEVLVLGLVATVVLMVLLTMVVAMVHMVEH